MGNSQLKFKRDLIVLQQNFEWMIVGKEMPISRIVIAVPNATVVLLD
jgi:hypothetical protein